MARTIHQGRGGIWQPSHGIVFGNIPLSSESSPPRALSTINISNSEHDVALRHNAADSSLLTSSLEFTSSNSSPCSVSQRNTDSDGSSWAASNTSQDRATTDLDLQDEIPGEVELGVQQGASGESHIPLTFQIPKDVLQKTKDAAPGTKESFWSYKMYLGPNNQGVKVHYCRSKQTTEKVAQYFLNEPVLGFDIEWKADSTRNSGIKNNVALVQLASESRIALFHIAAFPKDTASDLVAATMKKIMEDASITKVGVAIKSDCTRLRNFLNIDPKGIFELSHLYKLVKYSSSGDFNQINKKLVSLSTQAQEHLELPVFKGEVRGSDWTQLLSLDQIKCQFSTSNKMLFLRNGSLIPHRCSLRCLCKLQTV
jgi:exonuclease 3'-5' domain-containing protein 2